MYLKVYPNLKESVLVFSSIFHASLKVLQKSLNVFFLFSLTVHIYQAYGVDGVRTLPDKDGNFFVAGSLDPETRVKVS